MVQIRTPTLSTPDVPSTVPSPSRGSATASRTRSPTQSASVAPSPSCTRNSGSRPRRSSATSWISYPKASERRSTSDRRLGTKKRRPSPQEVADRIAETLDAADPLDAGDLLKVAHEATADLSVTEALNMEREPVTEFFSQAVALAHESVTEHVTEYGKPFTVRVGPSSMRRRRSWLRTGPSTKARSRLSFRTGGCRRRHRRLPPHWLHRRPSSPRIDPSTQARNRRSLQRSRHRLRSFARTDPSPRPRPRSSLSARRCHRRCR